MPGMADITDEELNALLLFENAEPALLSHTDSDAASKSNSQNMMAYNREPFPSQMSFSYDYASHNITAMADIDNYVANLTPLQLTKLSSINNNSIIVHSQDIEAINLNDSAKYSEFNITHNDMALSSQLHFSDIANRIKSEKFDSTSNQCDLTLVDSLEDDFPRLSDADYDEIERLERKRGSCGTKSTTLNIEKASCSRILAEKNKNIISLPILAVKEETLDFSMSQSANDDTFAQRFNADDDELPNMDLDFDLLDEVERAHTSRQTAVTMPEPSSITSTKNYGSVQNDAESIWNAGSIQISTNRTVSPIRNSIEVFANNLTTADTIPPSSVTLSHISSSSSCANPMDFLSLRFENSMPLNLNNEQQSSKNSNDIEELSNRIPSQPLDYSKRGVAEAADAINPVIPVIQESTFDIINDSVADATLIPLSVKQLYDVIKAEYSDFAFVYALSAQLCQDRVPMDCFVNLKMGLLLSIASIGGNPDIPPIPIIAIGNDDYMTNYLMTNVGQLADRFIGPTFDIKPPSNAGDKSHVWIEADPIILAKGGVYYVGDWSVLKAARVDKLFKIVECSRVPIDKTKYVYPLETSIWGHWRSFKNNAKEQQVFNNFVKIFGIPIVASDDNHEILVDYILQQSSVRTFESTIDHLSITEEDMRSFLAVISKRTVDHSADATSILQKYFVASRIERPDCLSKQAFVVLKQFAESFAKLAFRHEVLEIDAVAAIFMCEMYVQNIFGASDDPPPKFESHNYVGNVHLHLKKFTKWLRKYIERYHDRP